MASVRLRKTAVAGLATVFLAIFGAISAQFAAIDAATDPARPEVIKSASAERELGSESAEDTEGSSGLLLVAVGGAGLVGSLLFVVGSIPSPAAKRTQKQVQTKIVSVLPPPPWNVISADKLKAIEVDSLGLPKNQSRQLSEIKQDALRLLFSTRLAGMDAFDQEKLRLLLDEHLPEALSLYAEAGSGRLTQLAATRHLSQQLNLVGQELQGYQQILDVQVLTQQQTLSRFLQTRAPSTSALDLSKS